MRTSMIVVLAVTGLFMVGGRTLGAEEMTLTGTIGDAACGATHSARRLLALRGPDPMPDDARRCTLACVGHVGTGADFALIVEHTAYTLQTADDDLRMELEKLAGLVATVTGEVTGETIAVASVAVSE